MAYNKARAEKEWLKWKTAEEKKLRELGVDEDTIQRLHIYDWTQFNRERRYFQRQVEWTPYIDQMSAQELEIPVNDIESLLNSIENSKLLSVLIKADSLTLQIVLYKLQGFTSAEIARKMGKKEIINFLIWVSLFTSFHGLYSERAKILFDLQLEKRIPIHQVHSHCHCDEHEPYSYCAKI